MHRFTRRPYACRLVGALMSIQLYVPTHLPHAVMTQWWVPPGFISAHKDQAYHDVRTNFTGPCYWSSLPYDTIGQCVFHCRTLL